MDYISPEYEGEIDSYVHTDDGDWHVILGEHGVEDDNDYNDLILNKVIVSGMYRGFNEKYMRPDIVVQKIYDEKSNKVISTIYEGFNNVPTTTEETEPTEVTTVYETTVND